MYSQRSQPSIRTNEEKIFVKNKAQQALFEMELSGQISDGMWENASPSNHWESIRNAEVLVDEMNPRIENTRLRRRYGFSSPELIECVGNRMIKYARMSVFFNLEEIKLLEHIIDEDTYEVVPVPEWIKKAGDTEFYKKLLSNLEAALTDPATLERLNAVRHLDYDKSDLKRDLRALSNLVNNPENHKWV
jgi:hypothetical protein